LQRKWCFGDFAGQPARITDSVDLHAEPRQTRRRPNEYKDGKLAEVEGSR
jgi:hypothetical protein